MMRIKEAIQRRKLIQQLNDEYAAIEDDSLAHRKGSVPDLHGYGGNGRSALLASALRRNAAAVAAAAASGCSPNSPSAFRDADASSVTESDVLSASVYVNDEQRAYSNLQAFVAELNQRLNDGHRRALRVTWKRLSEPPKTSGRGTLQIMEKVFEQIFSGRPEAMSVFYRSAFLKCIDDRRYGRSSGTIATVRDHAHFVIDLIDAIMCVMFDTPLRKPVWDPATIGRAHAKYASLGFDAQIWHKLGECFAEVMFSQECVRAYPLAASAWSMLSVAITDKMYSHSCRTNRNIDVSLGTMRPTTSVNASPHDLRPICPHFLGHQSHRPHYPQSHSAPAQNPVSPPQRQQSSSSGSAVGTATPQRQFSLPRRSVPPSLLLPAFERINGWPHHPQQLQYHYNHHHHNHNHRQHHQHNSFHKTSDVRQPYMTAPQRREEAGHSVKEERTVAFVRAPPLAKCRRKESVTTTSAAAVGESTLLTKHK